jgi:hypothetical protein
MSPKDGNCDPLDEYIIRGGVVLVVIVIGELGVVIPPVIPFTITV